ncbi:hypothetical protein ACTXT7_009608 [Hymenolepis weldensis]
MPSVKAVDADQRMAIKAGHLDGFEMVQLLLVSTDASFDWLEDTNFALIVAILSLHVKVE